MKLHTGINIHASIHTLCIFKRICKHTQIKMDCSVTVVTIRAAITVTGRTFN